MASTDITSAKSGDGVVQGAKPVIAGSIKGVWIQCNDNLETAEAAADLLKPWNAGNVNVHWVRVPEGTKRVMVRAKNDAAATTVTTSPVVRLFAAYPKPNPTNQKEPGPNSSGQFSGTTTADNYATFLRLDNADANAAGITLTLAATGNLEDASYEYSDPNAAAGSLDGYDCKGGWWFGMLVETAANVTGGAAHGVYGECMFLD